MSATYVRHHTGACPDCDASLVLTDPGRPNPFELTVAHDDSCPLINRLENTNER